jgi:hypothetical protein
MIYILVILFSIFAPLAGAIGMENGSYSLTASEYGYRVGAIEAYCMYSVVIGLTIYVLKYREDLFGYKADFRPPSFFVAGEATRPQARLELLLLLVLGAVFAYHNVVLAGGWRVIRGLTERGEFRTELGAYGASAYLIIKCYAPVILAYACIVSFRSGDAVLYLLAFLIFILSALCSISFGYKASIVLLITPALTILFWKPRLLTLILFPSLGLALIIGGYFVFGIDKVGSAAAPELSKNGLIEQLTYRIFVLQGELPWKIWGAYVQGHDMPSYFETVKSLFGGRVGRLLLGTAPQTPEQIVASNFGMVTTHFAGYPIEGVLTGHNSTATAFSEGVIAGGITGVVAFSVFAGAVIYVVYQAIDVSLKKRNYVLASVFAVYSIFGVMSWLIGGGISTLLHISVIFGFLTSIGMLAAARFVSLFVSTRLTGRN